jgi:hypothetical protein
MMQPLALYVGEVGRGISQASWLTGGYPRLIVPPEAIDGTPPRKERGKRAHHRDGDVTLERLEHALAAISYAVLLDGPVYAPILDRLEREIATMRANEDVVSRARAHLEKFSGSVFRNGLGGMFFCVAGAAVCRPTWHGGFNKQLVELRRQLAICSGLPTPASRALMGHARTHAPPVPRATRLL